MSVQAVNRAAGALALAALFATASLAGAQAAARAAWVLADQPSATSPYAPDPSHSYNSAGGAMSVIPVSTGVWQVTFAGLASSLRSTVQVTAVNSNGYCTTTGWGGFPGSPMTADIACFDAEGVPANLAFSLLYQAHYRNTGDSAKNLAFLYADQPSAATYTPSAQYQYNSTSISTYNTILRNGVGNYTATLPGMTLLGGHVEVTAYGAIPARCKVSDWYQDTGGTHATVLCFDKTGAAADVAFNLAYSRALPVVFTTVTHTNGFYAWAQRASTASYKTSAPYSYNSDNAGRVTAVHLGKGSYSLTAPLADYISSNAVATAHGQSNDYCNVKGWYPLQVTCFSQGGKPKDSQFDVGYQFH